MMATPTSLDSKLILGFLRSHLAQSQSLEISMMSLKCSVGSKDTIKKSREILEEIANTYLNICDFLLSDCEVEFVHAHKLDRLEGLSEEIERQSRI